MSSARERGGALIGVLVASLLLGAILAALAVASHAQALTAKRRARAAQAQWVGLAALRTAASWFEHADRGSLVPPPALDQVDRDRRIVDPDRDGRGPSWRAAAPPWRTRYKEGGGPLFAPPDGPEPEHRLVGTRDGPDVMLARDVGEAARVLAALERAVGAPAGIRIASIAIFGPPAGASPHVLATIEVRTEAGRGVVRIASGEVAPVPWGRTERALVLDGDLTLEGEAGWSGGEAVGRGDLRATLATAATWPSAFPWAGPDRPLRDDLDGDGTDDDADGDGVPELSGWLARRGTAADPWWRGRFDGGWPGVLDDPSACEAPRPYGPLDDPPRPPDARELSGLRLGCPSVPTRPVFDAWVALARRGERGAALFVEDVSGSGEFRSRPGAPGRSVDEVLARVDGLVVLETAASRDEPLEVPLAGFEGALVVRGAGVVVEANPAPHGAWWLPTALRFTGGADRQGGRRDPWLEAEATGAPCGPQRVLGWREDGAPPRPSRCAERVWHLRGLLACEGAVELGSGTLVFGQIRAGSARFVGAPRAALVRAGALAGERPGPPGAPRVVLLGAHVR